MIRRARPSPNICLDTDAVQHCVTYTYQHIQRLEAEGRFPKRIRLGPGRIGWAWRDIMSWMQSKIDTRPLGPMSPKVTIEHGDRFIDKKELRTLVLYSPHHVRKMEYAGKFPGHIRIGDNRVAWLEREVREWVEVQRRRGEVDAMAETYHVRVCRPRIEVADVMVSAEDPDDAGKKALDQTNTHPSSWRLLPFDPDTYQPHIEACLQDEQEIHSTRAVASSDQDRGIRYLLLSADTASGKGTVVPQPWFSDEKLGDLFRTLAADWASNIKRWIKPSTQTRSRNK